jgi:hypothetical protein
MTSGQYVDCSSERIYANVISRKIFRAAGSISVAGMLRRNTLHCAQQLSMKSPLRGAAHSRPGQVGGWARTAALKVEAGRLWVLLATPPDAPGVVIRLNSEGEVERVFEISGASDVWRIAVMADARELLLSSASMSAVFRVRIADEFWNR